MPHRISFIPVVLLLRREENIAVLTRKAGVARMSRPNPHKKYWQLIFQSIFHLSQNHCSDYNQMTVNFEDCVE